MNLYDFTQDVVGGIEDQAAFFRDELSKCSPEDNGHQLCIWAGMIQLAQGLGIAFLQMAEKDPDVLLAAKQHADSIETEAQERWDRRN